LTIDLYQQYIFVQGEHQEAHPHPEYCQAGFPVKARQWIQEVTTFETWNCIATFVTTEISIPEFTQKSR
jgi:hypothetical protein